MLHDRVRIHVQAGAGGDGSPSFRREAHVPRGGPDGGDGGRGGDVVVICDESLRDLQRYRTGSRHKAGRGGHGEGALRHGAEGADLEIRVPPGTEIIGAEKDLEGRRWELLKGGAGAVIARGGTGGRGNKRFATPTRQAPRFAERGLPGEEGFLELRLKLLADVGLVGLPNAGKSSLLSRLTRAAPKIASYPFTTLEPVLGVLDGGERQLVIADIPGLIEGASAGAGLGHEFLAHVERTQLLVHVLDIAPELTDPGAGDGDGQMHAAHEIIEGELALHDPRLAALPRILVLSKADLLAPERAREVAREWSERLGPEVPVIATSSATRLGLPELAQALLHREDLWAAAEAPGARPAVHMETPMSFTPHGASGPSGAPGGASGTEQAEHMVFRPGGRTGFIVRQVRSGAYSVTGRGIELLVARYDPDNEDAMAYLEERLGRIGVLRALEEEGFQPGDELEIAGIPFDLDPRPEEHP